ncbi:hypothetical protein, variant [Capsaspora owczarzaki ATCC 30864]|uniref:BHLH domain-containing protein n=1 Tax=Capsaspora owczarzaki (strain ATCC 30864) TaxID=595528 RepID=A0A0D2X2Q5_CAPO3|nr:hypothetical protein, variant [Capsaspora owczarzaki ATCC 30864]
MDCLNCRPTEKQRRIDLRDELNDLCQCVPGTYRDRLYSIIEILTFAADFITELNQESVEVKLKLEQLRAEHRSLRMRRLLARKTLGLSTTNADHDLEPPPPPALPPFPEWHVYYNRPFIEPSASITATSQKQQKAGVLTSAAALQHVGAGFEVTFSSPPALAAQTGTATFVPNPTLVGPSGAAAALPRKKGRRSKAQIAADQAAAAAEVAARSNANAAAIIAGTAPAHSSNNNTNHNHHANAGHHASSSFNNYPGYFQQQHPAPFAASHFANAPGHFVTPYPMDSSAALMNMNMLQLPLGGAYPAAGGGGGAYPAGGAAHYPSAASHGRATGGSGLMHLPAADDHFGLHDDRHVSALGGGYFTVQPTNDDLPPTPTSASLHRRKYSINTLLKQLDDDDEDAHFLSSRGGHGPDGRRLSASFHPGSLGQHPANHHSSLANHHQHHHHHLPDGGPVSAGSDFSTGANGHSVNQHPSPELLEALVLPAHNKHGGRRLSSTFAVADDHRLTHLQALLDKQIAREKAEEQGLSLPDDEEGEGEDGADDAALAGLLMSPFPGGNMRFSISQDPVDQLFFAGNTPKSRRASRNGSFSASHTSKRTASSAFEDDPPHHSFAQPPTSIGKPLRRGSRDEHGTSHGSSSSSSSASAAADPSTLHASKRHRKSVSFSLDNDDFLPGLDTPPGGRRKSSISHAGAHHTNSHQSPYSQSHPPHVAHSLGHGSSSSSSTSTSSTSNHSAAPNHSLAAGQDDHIFTQPFPAKRSRLNSLPSSYMPEDMLSNYLF